MEKTYINVMDKVASFGEKLGLVTHKTIWGILGGITLIIGVVLFGLSVFVGAYKKGLNKHE